VIKAQVRTRYMSESLELECGNYTCTAAILYTTRLFCSGNIHQWPVGIISMVNGKFIAKSNIFV
jgi:hypothetical protein